MKIYLKNKTTLKISIFEVKSYLSLSKNIRDQYDEATQVEINSFLLKEARNNKIGICLNFLKETDWYTNREVDEPNSYPQDIKDLRKSCRLAINELELASSIEAIELCDVNQFKLN